MRTDLPPPGVSGSREVRKALGWAHRLPEKFFVSQGHQKSYPAVWVVNGKQYRSTYGSNRCMVQR
ncbi:hypothetical protein ACWGNM_00195 [Streptomyces sp. NPDC055796]